MLELDDISYDFIDNDNLGNFSLGWVNFHNGLFDRRETLIKSIPGEDPNKSSLIYPNKENFDIPYIALNPLVSELICKTGDSEGEVAEYFLAKQRGRLLICTPSFKKTDETLINVNDLMKIGHKNLKMANPNDVLRLANDISEELIRRRVPKENIRNIIVQFLKDGFKKAYLGIFDPNNDNSCVLISKFGTARSGPLYDLDLGLNVPFEYKDNVDPEFKEFNENYLKTINSPDYLAKFVSTIQRKFPWFEDWVERFMQNTKHIDLKKQLSEKKGIDVPDEQIKHYTDFINERNGQLQKYLYETRYENFLEF